MSVTCHPMTIHVILGSHSHHLAQQTKKPRVDPSHGQIQGQRQVQRQEDQAQKGSNEVTIFHWWPVTRVQPNEPHEPRVWPANATHDDGQDGPDGPGGPDGPSKPRPVWGFGAVWWWVPRVLAISISRAFQIQQLRLFIQFQIKIQGQEKRQEVQEEVQEARLGLGDQCH